MKQMNRNGKHFIVHHLYFLFKFFHCYKVAKSLNVVQHIMSKLFHIPNETEVYGNGNGQQLTVYHHSYHLFVFIGCKACCEKFRYRYFVTL